MKKTTLLVTLMTAATLSLSACITTPMYVPEPDVIVLPAPQVHNPPIVVLPDDPYYPVPVPEEHPPMIILPDDPYYPEAIPY